MKDLFERKIDYLRVSITDLCNYRCQYCMPENGLQDLDLGDHLSFHELLEIISEFVDLGIKKVRITGGEPLIRKGVVSFIQHIKNLGVEEIAMTTNGALLHAMAKDLKEAGLNRVNISLDTLDSEKFKILTRGGKLENVLKGIEKAKEVGLTPIKVNTVLIKNFNDEEVEDLIHWAVKEDIILRFIELMPIGEGIEFKDNFLPVNSILTEDFQKLEGDRHSPAQYYSYKNKGTIGLIHPLTGHFCEACNRLRLDAKGNIIPCLHSSLKINLKQSLGNQKKLREQIEKALLLKPDKHKMNEGQYKKEFMHRIGG